jgi:predicted carbohydrate-binding protein with CBM5 and CBM33 domain
VGRNLIINLVQGSIVGLITASQTRHAIDTITGEDYRQLGEVTNTPAASINNGVIVSLTQSSWTITGTSYLTSLAIGEGSSVQAPKGSSVSMTVDGQLVPVQKGSYKGQIVLTLSKS